MLELEVFVRERLAVDALPAGAVAVREVAALDHEVCEEEEEEEEEQGGRGRRSEDVITTTNRRSFDLSIGRSSREDDDDDDDDDADARARAPLMTRWNEDPLNPNPFSPVASARKFSAVFGVVFPYSPISIRPAGSPAMGDVEEHRVRDLRSLLLLLRVRAVHAEKEESDEKRDEDARAAG